jgi:DNA-binding transcriptional LysR family regulator
VSGMRSRCTLISPLFSARRAFLARAVGVALCAAFPLAHAGETKLAKADWRAIRKVISQQLAALRAGNTASAFGYASPGIQAQFGDAETFMAMVRGAYSALLVARYTEFLEGAVIDGIVIQPMRLIAPDNTVQVALYTLERDGKRNWRINGCRLAPSTVQAA